MNKLYFIAIIFLAETVQGSSAAQYFSPRPGATVRLSETDIAQLPKTADPRRLRGFIEVNPPKGCLEIFRGDETGSDMICKKTALAFRLGDMDRAGRITWNVRTSNLDQGTTLQWQTPYRLAITTPRSKDSSAPSDQQKPDYWRDLPTAYKFIKECRDTSNQHLRQIEVSFFSGETWRFQFPDQHKLLPQPDPIPNLSVGASRQKQGIPSSGKPSKPAGEEVVADKPDAASEAVETFEDEAPDNDEDRKQWSVPLRDSFAMSSDNFFPDKSKARGSRGLCRYNFKGPDEDPHTGRIECQDTPYFHMLLLPLTCLNAVKGDR